MYNPTILDEYDIINYEAGMSDDVLGAECQSCFRLLTWEFFPKNTSYKTGHEPQCWKCKQEPRLSMAEHVSRLREMNMNSEGTRRQKHVDQELFKAAKGGRFIECSLFLQKLLSLVPSLYVTQGGIIGDLSLYVTSGVAKPEWAGNTFKYMGYVTLGPLPEYSKYEFNDRDVLQRCTQIGWRTVLLRFIKAHVLTEEQCNREFGHPSGGAGSLWFKKLHDFRNAKKVA